MARSRWAHHEWWPAWALYAPLVPWIAALGLRHAHPLACLAANPGIGHGGGLVDESKFAIARGFEGTGTPRGRHAHTRLVDAGGTPDQRAAAALALIRDVSDLRGFPVILKPDAGQRGHGVRLARSHQDVHTYFRHTSRAVIVQEYHPGPEECGIFWIRGPSSRHAPPTGQREGFIFSITRKRFPEVRGDGRQTLEQLIWAHPRLSLQAAVFHARLGAAGLRRIPAEGESIRLGEAGNHAQGACFTDGMDLWTPALEDAIDAIARNFRGVGHAGIDFGRFDVRYESDEALRRGEGFAIVEFNGTSAEATALYDPGRGLRHAYGLLFAQWRHLYRVGAARRATGHKPPSLGQVLGWWRHHRATRDGPAVSD